MMITKRELWIKLGRIGFVLTKPGIRLVVKNSRRSRVLITCANEYLLLQHWLGDESWMLPGGGLHGREDPLAGAIREVREELGLQLKPADFTSVGQFKARDDGFQFSYDLYIVDLPTKPELQLQRLEILEARWFRRAGAVPLPACPELAQALANWRQAV